jgi:hypothetical protein
MSEAFKDVAELFALMCAIYFLSKWMDKKARE